MLNDITLNNMNRQPQAYLTPSYIRMLVEKIQSLENELNYLKTLTSEGDQQAEREIYKEQMEEIANVITGKSLFNTEINLPHGAKVKVDGLHVKDFEWDTSQQRLLLIVKAISEKIVPVYEELDQIDYSKYTAKTSSINPTIQYEESDY